MNKVTTVGQHDSDNSVPHTLWSATMLDMLIDSLEKNHSDEKIIPLINSLYYKHYGKRYILTRVRSKLGEAACNRLMDIFASVK